MPEDTVTNQGQTEKAPGKASPSRGAGQGIVGFLSSIKLAVALLIILASVSIIGTVLAQGESAQDNIRFFTNAVWGFYGKLGLVGQDTPADKLEHYRQQAQGWGLRLYNLSHRIGLDRLYNSWYFNFFLGLLSLNLIVCSLKHWPHTWRFFKNPKLALEGEGAAGIPMRRELKLKGDARAAVEAARSALAAKGYKALLTELDGSSHLFAQKGLWGRLGIYVTHLSVLVIFLGAFVGLQYGRKGFVAIEEGSSVDVVNQRGGKGVWKLPFTVRCDDFEVSYYEGTSRPKDYKSALTVLEGSREVLSKTIEVNDPLIYPPTFLNLWGIYFYQSSFGETGKAGQIKLRLTSTDGSRKADVSLPLFGEVKVPEFGLSIGVLRGEDGRPQFFPDFVMQGGRAATKSSQVLNPAVALGITMPDGRVLNTWSFRNYPEVHSLSETDFRIALLDYQGIQYTGLQVAYDPGTWIVWLGCTLMVVGIFMAFFVPHRRVWVKVEAPGRVGSSVWVAGSTSKNRAGFEDEFEALAAAVKESLASPAGRIV